METASLDVATFCNTRQEFIDQFRPFLDATTIFVPSKLPLSVGQPVRFSIALRDRTPMLEGSGEVTDVQDRPGGPAGRRGVRVRVAELTEASRRIRSSILIAQRMGMPARPAPGMVTGDRPPAPPPPAMAAPPPPPPPPPPLLPPPRRPAPALPSEVTPTGSTRLFAQGVQVAVRPLIFENGGTGVVEAAADPLGDVSSQSLMFYLDCNLAEGDDDPEALADQESAAGVHAEGGRPAPEDSTTVADRQPPILAEPTLPAPPPVAVPAPPPVPPLRPISPATPAPAPAPRRPPPRLRALAAIGGSALATILVCWLIWGGSDEPNPAAQHSPVGTATGGVALAATAPVAPAAPVATAAAAPARPAVASAPPREEPAPAGCTADIDSRPRGAQVKLGNQVLGVTPLDDVAVPCQAVTVTVARPRYSPASKALSPTPGVPAAALVRLERPPGKLVVVSTPPGAAVSVNRVRAGAAGQELAVARFERVRVEVSQTGYKPWTKTVYLAAPRTTLKAVLQRGSSEKSASKSGRKVSIPGGARPASGARGRMPGR